MTTTNGNIHAGPPFMGTHAWDWADLENNSVTIWRGTRATPMREHLLSVEGSPLEVAEWLDGIADAVRATHVRDLRERGWSWTEVGDKLGVSKQAAWERYGRTNDA